jgi:16S rRNA (adenine1518-N6/adenine1519-N6)-dimethyltransferase
LTLPLLARGLTVVAVEKDLRLCEVLAEKVNRECKRGELRLIHQDILSLDPQEGLCWDGAPKRWICVGNLPYSISTPAMEWIIAQRRHFEWASFMVQREYGERIVAPAGSKTYGSLSVFMAYHFRCEKLMDVDAANFWPVPKVNSVVMILHPHREPPVDIPSLAVMEKVVRTGFSQRRKMMAGTISKGLGIPRDRLEAAMIEAGIALNARPEVCDLNQFAALTRILVDQGLVRRQ